MEFDAAAVDVECFEDFQHFFHGKVVINRPVQDIKVFVARFQPLENLIDEDRVSEFSLQKSEVVELDPEGSALEVFEPARPEKSIPVFADPTADGGLTQIFPGFFALDPLVPLRLDDPPIVDAHSHAWADGLRRGGTTLAHRDLRTR